MKSRTYDILNAGPRNRFMASGRIVSNSSRGAQLHNLPRGLFLKKRSVIDAVIRDISDGATFGEIEELHGPPIVLASELLRPVFWTDSDHWMARGDSKQIEARVLPWLAGAQWKLDAFARYDAGEGPDLYKVGAGGIYHVAPESIGDEDPRRQVGKVSELALGFQGGAPALQNMAKGYGVKIPRAVRPAGADWDWQAPDGTDEWIKQQWRAANPEVSDRDTGLWGALERAAVTCVQSPIGTVVRVEGCAGELGVRFKRNTRAMGMWLPSGHPLFYWSPKLVTRMTPWGKEKLTVIYRAEDSQTKQWTEYAAYGGLWCENLVQATARELMAWWLLAMRAAGILPVLTVHDEGIGEAQRRLFADPDAAAEAVLSIMRRKPAYAAGLPVSAEASAGLRYVKS
jgi:DNA polymerase bacteriophage-type